MVRSKARHQWCRVMGSPWACVSGQLGHSAGQAARRRPPAARSRQAEGGSALPRAAGAAAAIKAAPPGPLHRPGHPPRRRRCLPAARPVARMRPPARLPAGASGRAPASDQTRAAAPPARRRGGDRGKVWRLTASLGVLAEPQGAGWGNAPAAADACVPWSGVCRKHRACSLRHRSHLYPCPCKGS